MNSIFGPSLRREYGSFLTQKQNQPLMGVKTKKVSAKDLKGILYDQLIQPYQNYTQPRHGVGTQISFSEFIATRPDGGEILFRNKTGNPLVWADLFEAMGKNPSQIVMSELASMDTFGLLLGLAVQDAFIKGFSETSTGQPPLWSKICFATGVDAKFDQIDKTWFTFPGEPVPTAQGENFPEAKITLGSERIRLEKRGLTLRLTTEFARSNPLTIVESWLVEMGRVYQHQENGRCVDCLLNGDVPGGVNAAPVIGVVDPAKGLQYEDLVNCWMVGDEIGEQFFTMISGRVMGTKIALMEEFKRRDLQKRWVCTTRIDLLTEEVIRDLRDGGVVQVDAGHGRRGGALERKGTGAVQDPEAGGQADQGRAHQRREGPGIAAGEGHTVDCSPLPEEGE